MRTFLYTLTLSLLLPETLPGQIVINEIIPPHTVELRNLGGSTVDISGYALCQFPTYDQLSNIPLLCGGDLMIEGGSLVAVTVDITLNAADGELGLYFTYGNFGSPGNITDYVEWGSTGHVRSSVAQAAGIWTAGDFVPDWSACASLEYDGSGDASTDWVSQDMPTSPCMPNSLDGCGGVACSISDAGLADVSCVDNDSPSDPSDDYISFSLNPTGISLGATYSVMVDIGTIMPTSASYGSPTNFQLQAGSAGGGDVTVTITDSDDGPCTLDVDITDPGSCSDLCAISTAGLSGIFCNNSGTPSDPSDDNIMFNLDPEGLNLAATYLVTVSNGSVSPSSAPYGMLTVFHLNNGSAGNGNVTVTVTDSNDGGCTAEVVVTDPGTCSDVCELLDGGVDNIACNDNGTMTDSDDYITFTLNPNGNNLGTTYSVTVNTGTIDPTTGTYGSPVPFTLNNGSAGGGNVPVTILDDDDSGCSITEVITDPGACSQSCNLSNAGLADIMCNDNDSPSDPGDDYISFTLNPVGVNLGTTYSVTVSAGAITPTTGTYGTPMTFLLNNGSAGGGNVMITITDGSNLMCMVSATVTDPGSCSPSCGIANGGLSMITCHDAGTPADPSDDFIGFSLNPTGGNLSAMYTVAVSTGAIAPDTGAYGMATAFVLNNGSAGNGNVTVTLTDLSDTSCTLDVTIADPGSCSGACNLVNVGLSMVSCDPNGTTDMGDDIITFALNPSGTGLAASYTVAVSSGIVMPDSADYGSTITFTMNPGSAGGGDVTVTVTDVGDPACTVSAVISDPGVCSQSCMLTGTGLADVACNNNSTLDGSDDFITFSMNPTGASLATTYAVAVSNGTVMPTVGSYGSTTTFTLNPGSAGGSNITVTIIDNGDPGCSIEATVSDPGSCSCDVAACDISTESETTICVDDGTVDSINVICHPGTVGMNVSWIVTDTNGIILSLPALGDTAFFTFEGQASGVCLIWRVAWDGTVGGLAVGADVDTLSGCFDLSNSIAVTKLTGGDCGTYTFNPALDRLIRLYPVPVSEILRIETHDNVVIHRVRVFDVIGRTVLHMEELNPSTINLGSLETGMYYVMLETNFGWNLQRIAVSR